jgi:hypothetical protein
MSKVWSGACEGGVTSKVDRSQYSINHQNLRALQRMQRMTGVVVWGLTGMWKSRSALMFYRLVILIAI